MKQDIPKAYNPSDYEEKIYQLWEKSGFFNPDNLLVPEDAPAYTIILPPPNITDKLHVGHAATIAIEDLLVRYHRLRGFRTLWLPGTDHAAIATQNVVEKKLLKEEGKTRHDLGREKFLEAVQSFVKVTQSTILEQTRKLGASLDWSRLAFTLDDSRQQAVRRLFVDMYKAGAIYRGERLVNWCPRCHSTLADDEVDHKEELGKLYWIKYGPFVLATSRPETKLGDTAVAVHPDDKRYQSLIGQEVDIEGVLGKFKVKIVADKAVDVNFGSGAIKVTPAHSFVDNEIAARHNLVSKKIIDEDGRMMANCGKYQGLTTKEAREAIVADMQAMGLIDHIEDAYLHNLSVCYRCGTVIEPLPSKQWFVAVDKKLERLEGKSLKEAALLAAASKQVEFIPNRFAKRYGDWMENLHDWCVSRQIWFGHQIPVWYRGEEIYVGEEAPQDAGWLQDRDTLDTWFSSGMWTFSTLGWPNNFINGKKTGDLAKFHPTQVLETGYEIITLWVSRMIMMSLFAIGEIPFEKVYLHGMILDKDGKKMSKSKGNGVDPADMIIKYGADALRLSLLTGATPGNDSRFSEEKLEAKRNFINKLWNISRYILSTLEDGDFNQDQAPKVATLADKWILNQLTATIKTVSERLDSCEFSLAAEELDSFTWEKLADWYLEIAKIEGQKSELLVYILRTILKLWHPFIPYVSEAIWSQFNHSLLLVAKWPAVADGDDINLNSDMDRLVELIKNIRDARSQNSIEPAKKLDAVIVGSVEERAIMEEQVNLIKGLKTGLGKISFASELAPESSSIIILCGALEVHLLAARDELKEKARLAKEKANLEKMIFSLENKLANAEFKERAPQNIVSAEEDRLATYKQELEKINNL